MLRNVSRNRGGPSLLVAVLAIAALIVASLPLVAFAASDDGVPVEYRAPAAAYQEEGFGGLESGFLPFTESYRAPVAAYNEEGFGYVGPSYLPFTERPYRAPVEVYHEEGMGHLR